MHWFGLFAAGAASFGKSVTPWIAGTLGLWGILSIMLGASKKLDEKQGKNYGGQAAYDRWRESVKWSVIPFLK